MFRLFGSCTGAVVAATLAGAITCSAAVADEPVYVEAPDAPATLTWNPSPAPFPLGVLIERLYGETRAGRIAWAETDRANSFVTAFNGYTVEIRAVTRPRSDFPHYIMSTDYVIAIYDANGRAVVRASDVSLDNQLGPRNATFFPLMGQMWDGARRTVLGTDRAIASIQGQLDGRRCNNGAPVGYPDPATGATSSRPCS